MGWVLVTPPIQQDSHDKFFVNTSVPLSKWEIHRTLYFKIKGDCEQLRVLHIVMIPQRAIPPHFRR
jgi:hypothetical protein